jgi:DNA-directed RNA polymerase subunit RPC12/RpoP
MKICTQCANPTNKPEIINKEIVCQECSEKLTMKKLNENELKVLKSLVKSSADNGHDFGFTDEYEECGFTKHQMAGYIGQLSTKGYIELEDLSKDPGTICNAVQFNFTKRAENILEDVYVESNHY